MLIENKLNKYFDKLIFIGATKKLRLKRYIKKRGEKKTFNLLDKRQISQTIKKNICDHIIDNNYSLAILRKNVKIFLKNYE